MKKSILIGVCLLLLVAGGGLIFHQFFLKEHYEARFPIDFVPYAGQPRIEVNIQGRSWPLMIDLGSDSYITLKKEVLEGIEKERLRSIRVIDMKGHKYSTDVYRIPEMRMRNLVVSKIEVIEESADFLEKGGVIYSDTNLSKDEIIKNKPGRIGRRLFHELGVNLFLDCQRSVIFACCHLTDRIKDGYNPRKFKEIPFELKEKEGIVLKAETDLGEVGLMLDTGATRSCIRDSLIDQQKRLPWKKGIEAYRTSKFIAGEKDFGQMEFLLFELGEDFDEIDGVLGMDFLGDHVVYLDFQNKKAYIGCANDVMFEDLRSKMPLNQGS